MTPVSAQTNPTADDDAGRHRARRLPLLGAFLAGALLLSACGGSPEGGAQTGPNESPGAASTSPSASGQANRGAEEPPDANAGHDEESGEAEAGDEYVPASSDGPAKNVPMPEHPPEMSREAADGAEAAVEYWFVLFEYARLSGDTEPLRAMSGDGCTKCAHDLDNIDAVYDVDGWYADVEYTVDDIEFSVRNGRANGNVRVSSPGFRSYEADGTEHQSDGMNRSPFRMELAYVDERWQVLNWSSLGTSS